MAIRSTFYDTKPGEGVSEVSWAQSALSRGALYGVAGKDDLKLTAHPTTPYAVNLSAGEFFGHGVWDVNESVALVQCATPAAGSTRWDLIVGRRDWQPAGGGPTSLRAISGSSTMAIPAGRENRPGVIDDQPLWLVQWKAGLPQPQQIIDLRVWSGPGGVEAVHKVALDYLGAPGAAVKIDKAIWRYEVQSNGVWGWKEYAALDATTPMFRHGFKVVWTNVDGFTTVPFDTHFPKGCLVAVGAPMNPPVNGSVLQFISAGAGGANFRCFDLAGNPLKSQRVGIGYIATGF